MKTEQRKVSDLSNDPANARKHNDKNIDAIIASLRRFGQQKPIVIDRNNIVRAGNGTLEAARRLQWESIDCVVTSLNGSDAVAYAIADNRTAELAEWDEDTLAAQLNGLLTESEELALSAGFTPEEIEAMVALAEDEPEIQEDDVPEPPVDPITKPGDLWLLGDHRLLCGDSTKAEDVERLMAGAKADLWLTDPPYNVAYEGGSKKREAIANDSMSAEDFRVWLCQVFANAFSVMKPGAVFYIWHADTEGYNFRGAIIDCKQKVRQCLVWNKNNSMFSRQDYHWKHEPCLYGWKDGAAHQWFSDRKQTTVLEFDRPSRSEEHPTMKPVALIAYQIGNSLGPQGLVYDSFLGSGTTLIAAEQLGRKCYGMEISPQYCDVIVKRWENLTGRQAVLEEVAQ